MIIEGTDEFYRMAKSILKEDADCQDAVQEAVSKAFASKSIHCVRKSTPKPGLSGFC